MSDHYGKSRSMNPPSFYEQGAASRQREMERFAYWNKVLIPFGQRKWK